MRATAEHVQKLVAERHAAVKLSYEALLRSIASGNRENTKKANYIFLAALEALGNVIAREHWPIWLSVLIKNCKNYDGNHSNGEATWLAHLKAIFQHGQALDSHQWFSEEHESSAFDVDRLIEQAQQRNKIDELFERIIETLRALAESGELDSVKALSDLEEIIRILRQARSGSFSSKIASWAFVKRFIPNLITAYAKNSDLAGPAIEAFEQTAKELDIGLAQATNEIATSLRKIAEEGFKSQAIETTLSQPIPLLAGPEADTPLIEQVPPA